ncbi:hypothetical protein DFO61_2340 [Ectopseudomonas oleovorans]|uniref:Lipoprotein n=1 Tax=Ectopseudomonas oleovorans TaxID=301 RepID=A0A397N2R8_ECTOL|nr:hypothetical protein [Pseudomonas oleovorans]RIA31616.1 hypothetical protein DFO61_2340 [Pseudomonas oleovorans]
MKYLISASLLVLLAGCASQQKSDNTIYMEAATQFASTLPPDQKTLSFPSIKIPSHAMLADSLTIASGGGANSTQLQQELLAAKASGSTGFLIIGSSSALDLAVIEGATDSQDLSGMSIFYSGSTDKKSEIRSAIEKSKASFHYISAE